MNSLGTFLSALVDRGHVLVDQEPPVSDEAVLGVLAQIERISRLNAPADAPPYIPQAAVWGAEVLYRCCQFLVFRDVEAEVIRQTLAPQPPEPIDHGVIYSVDLLLRFLPSLYSLAQGAAPGDPLVKELQILGSRWPLSSVGMSGVKPQRLDAILSDRCLRRMYVDRVVERSDGSRLHNVTVRDEVAAALGAHPVLCPVLARLLVSTG